jgi:hypothetical protein
VCFVIATDDYSGTGDDGSAVAGALTFAAGSRLAAVSFDEDPGWWSGFLLAPPVAEAEAAAEGTAGDPAASGGLESGRAGREATDSDAPGDLEGGCRFFFYWFISC